MKKKTKTSSSLAKTLAHSEEIKGVVKECAEKLSGVNVAIKKELADHDPPAGVEEAIEISEEVEIKVQDAAEQLAVVNKALKDEILERTRLETQLISVKAQEESARHSAFHDPLTSLPNRILFNERLEHSLTQASRHDWNLAVMFVDLNKFKDINDQYGHDAGDAVLKIVSQRLKETIRTRDTISRHGGDEFLYLLRDIKNIPDAILIAKKIIKTIQMPCDIGTRNLVVKASIGIAMFPDHGKSAEELIKNADKAMYQAKQLKSGYAIAQ